MCLFKVMLSVEIPSQPGARYTITLNERICQFGYFQHIDIPRLHAVAPIRKLALCRFINGPRHDVPDFTSYHLLIASLLAIYQPHFAPFVIALDLLVELEGVDEYFAPSLQRSNR
jgi:hypothetical protein